jgi:hypothetical protein
MNGKYTAKTLLNTIREGLLDIGYREELLQENYGFTDMFTQDQPFRFVELGVFAQEPHSYRNACFGVVSPLNHSPETIMEYRALGAPQIFALHPEIGEIFCWKIMAHGSPILIDKIEISNLRNAIHSHRSEWNPESILRAKSIRFSSQPIQLDFFDMGLVPVLEGIVYQKLDRLLNDVIASCESVYKEHHEEELDYQALFRLIFRLIAAKLLGDRQYSTGWLNPDAREVIQLVENFYFQHTQPEAVLGDIFVQDTAWRHIRTAFSFRNLSVEALAYVYENTLVTPQIRKDLGTHATPPEIAEYIVQNLPLEELPYEDRHIFEPFCGHAPFLTAALARLRTLLPIDMHTEQRHEYFIRMLSGMEVDSFACEAARNSLILADFPNPNGWSITNADFFALDNLDKYLNQAQVVLCNPPYENFKLKQRQTNRSITSANKAVEALLRILQRPPKMLSIVLPRVFINGRSYREIRRQINSLYKNQTLVELPPIFNFSEAETVLLIAFGNQAAQSVWRSVLIEKKDYQQFVYTGQPTQIETTINFNQSKEDDIALQYGRLQYIWEELASLPRLGNIADIHRGIEYNISLRKNEDKLFSKAQRDGFARGLRQVTDDFEPYFTTSSTYLNMDPKLMRREAYKLPWDKPKVIANAARISTDRWLIAGAIDEQGLVCSQRFHGIWPTGDIPIEVIAALINSPVANALLSKNRTSRDNQIRILKQIPIPRLRKSQIHLIVSLVREYISLREQWRSQSDYSKYLEGSCRGIIKQIDAELLSAYNLPIQLEQELVKYFEGYKRPGPISLTQVKPSSSKRLYTSIIRIEDIRNEGDNKILDAVVISWNPHQVIHLPISIVPRNLRENLGREVRLLAKVNVGAKEAKDLIFEDIELAPELKINDKLA